MTDIVKGFTVTLSRGIKDYEFESIKKAVGMIKGVVEIHPQIEDGKEYITLMRRDREIREALLEFISQKL